MGGVYTPTSDAFQVSAELPIKGKRADIFLNWKNNDELFGVIVEAKFDHRVTTGQLPTYRKFIRNIFKPKNNYALVLLSHSGEKESNNPEWQPKSWLTVMSHWERNLQSENESETGFTILRQFIWNKLRN